MKNLIKALSEFQNECPIIHKDTKGHNYTYADLPQIFSVINPLLNKHKLCFTQLLENDGIRTILFHVESGEQIESHTPIPLVKLGAMNEYQSYGSGVTYFRRYALSSMLGLVTDKDTDAAGTSTTNDYKKYQQQNPQLETLIHNTTQFDKEWEVLVNDVKRAEHLDKLQSIWNLLTSDNKKNKDVIQLFSNRKQQLN